MKMNYRAVGMAVAGGLIFPLAISQANIINGDNINSSIDNLQVNENSVITTQSEQEIEWLEIELESAGSLGVEILYKVNLLSDVENLRIKGPLNDNDMTTLKNMNLKRLDLAEAIISKIPDSQFRDKTNLIEITLPSSLASIGQYAFYNTRIEELLIPASVSSIANYFAAQNPALKRVEFGKGSKLTQINPYSFNYDSSLSEIIFPEGLRTIGEESFLRCALTSLDFPEGLTSINQYAFDSCQSLSEVKFPSTLNSIASWAFRNTSIKELYLPENLTSLDNYAFYDMEKLNEVHLPVSLSKLSYQFLDCKNITRVVCMAPTPPVITNSSFAQSNLGSISLIVPEFAVVNYKLDNFWMKFGNIETMSEGANWPINGTLNLANNRRMNGVPNVTVKEQGALIIGGVMPMPMNDFKIDSHLDYSYSTSYWGQLLNSTEAVTASTAKINIWSYGNRWHFISLPFDCKVSDITHDYGAQLAIRFYDGSARAANGSGKSWKDFGNDDIIKAGQGIILMTDRNANVQFHAVGESITQLFKFSDWTTPLEMNPSENIVNEGWNYVGNPFNCNYDMYYTYSVAPITLWNIDNNNYQAYSLLDDDVILRPMEGFFIQASEGLGEINFNAAGRQLSTVANPRMKPTDRSASDERYRIDLRITDANGMSDNSRVVINENADSGYNPQEDAVKMYSDSDSTIELSTLNYDAGDIDYAINERPYGDANIKLNIKSRSKDMLRLEIMRADLGIKLHNVKSGHTIEIKSGDSLSISPDDADSLMLIAERPVTTGLDNNSISNIELTISDMGLTVRNAENKNLSITAIDGVTLLNEMITSSDTTISLPSGIYVVRIGEDSFKCIIK